MIDINQSDPRTAQALKLAYEAVEIINALHSAATKSPLIPGSELHRLDAALPPGPVSFGQTIMASTSASCGALDQISRILTTNVPTSPIALQALMRAALVGTARTFYALLPTDPSDRDRNAHSLVLQDVKSCNKALPAYGSFQTFASFNPPTPLVSEAKQQEIDLLKVAPYVGDGAIVTAMMNAFADVLDNDNEVTDPAHRRQLQEHAKVLWNTYSGAAHALFWPQLLPATSTDQRIPGDFAADLWMIATAALIAQMALMHRLQPASANYDQPLDMTDPTSFIKS